MDKALYIIGIVIAAGGLVDAIFNKNKDVSGKILDLENRIKILENK